ncbi:MAG: ECF transporter S component [Candidatus Thorarchaeota archaeon]
MPEKINDFRTTVGLVVLAIMTSLTTVATILIAIPFPTSTGYLNFGDVMVMISGFILGPVGGFIAGGVGSMMGDVTLGYIHFAPITLMVKGTEGFLVGLFARKAKDASLHIEDILGIILGAIAMLAGYYLAEAIMFGAPAAFAELVTLNIIQVTVGGILTAVVGPKIRGFTTTLDENHSSESLPTLEDELTAV